MRERTDTSSDRVPQDLRAFAVPGERLVVFELDERAVTAPEDLGGGLTQAEREILLAIAGGASNAEIALRRGTSLRTVANQVAGLLRKLGAGSRSELVLQASRSAP
ncbi:MAG TPA: helix-turn-helix transcriptional regulator [Polyangiaceae bacterium]|nr:helix-turn-helix transcriptional regulator [Polyangiaceae bacterium]